MGRVDAFRLPGLDLWFNSSDHLPPHFHAEKLGLWEVRVFFLRDPSEMVEKKWGREPRPAELVRLVELAERHRPLLNEEWERKVGRARPQTRR
jgi:hypothetical protein